MPNKNYIKGVAKERKIVNDYKALGWDIVQRTAGSHSPIDVIAINQLLKTIKFIQAKPDKYNSKILEDKYRWLNGIFRVEFEVI